jgi:hypothetical protein
VRDVGRVKLRWSVAPKRPAELPLDVRMASKRPAAMTFGQRSQRTKEAVATLRQSRIETPRIPFAKSLLQRVERLRLRAARRSVLQAASPPMGKPAHDRNKPTPVFDLQGRLSLVKRTARILMGAKTK